MSDGDARAFITQVAPLGTMDYSLLQKRPPLIDTHYGFSWPVPPATLIIGVGVIILLIAGVALGCYVYRMGKAFSLATGTIKKITDKPLSVCRRLFSRIHKHTRPVTSPRTTHRGLTPSPCSRNTPSTDDQNLEGCFPGPSSSPQVCEAP